MVRCASLGLLAVLIGFSDSQAAPMSPQAYTIEARARADAGATLTFGGLATRVWLPATPSISPELVVVLHGDLAGPGDSYQYDFARSVRDALPDTVVVAILRPGYADGKGGRSPGRQGLTTGDNYTPEVVEALDAAIKRAKARYRAKAVTLVGHSGGAALAANLAEVDPSIASRLLLVSCPCDLPRWRAHMALQQTNPAWLLPVRSRSPSDGVRNLPHDLRLAMVVGEKDTVTPPQLTTKFAEDARAVGIRTTVRVLPGVGHYVLLDPRVLSELVSLQASERLPA